MSEETGAGSKPLSGVVKWFNDAKGFGFIEHTDGKDVFVHYSVIDTPGFKTLKDGEEVLYEFKEGPKGLHAVYVERKNAPKADTQAAEEVQDIGLGASGFPREQSSHGEPVRVGLAAEIVQQVVPAASAEDGEDESDRSPLSVPEPMYAEAKASA